MICKSIIAQHAILEEVDPVLHPDKHIGHDKHRHRHIVDPLSFTMNSVWTIHELLPLPLLYLATELKIMYVELGAQGLGNT